MLPDKERETYAVRYDAVNAMLINEFLKEHRKVEEQGALIAKQRRQIESLTAGVQKVSHELTATSRSHGKAKLSESNRSRSEVTIVCRGSSQLEELGHTQRRQRRYYSSTRSRFDACLVYKARSPDSRRR